MKKLLLVMSLLTCIGSMYAVDELWQKTMQIMENSQWLVPGKTTFVAKTSGNLIPEREHRHVEVVIGHTLGDDGKVVNNVISQRNHAYPADTRSGRTVDREIVEAALEEDETPSGGGMFFETDPEKFSVKKIRGSKRVEGKPCVAYEIRYSESGNRDEQLRGTVWVESATGAPLLVELKIPGFPAGVKADLNLEFKYDPETSTCVMVKASTIISQGSMNESATIEQTQLREDFWEFPEEHRSKATSEE